MCTSYNQVSPPQQQNILHEKLVMLVVVHRPSMERTLTVPAGVSVCPTSMTTSAWRWVGCLSRTTSTSKQRSTWVRERGGLSSWLISVSLHVMGCHISVMGSHLCLLGVIQLTNPVYTANIAVWSISVKVLQTIFVKNRVLHILMRQALAEGTVSVLDEQFCCFGNFT